MDLPAREVFTIRHVPVRLARTKTEVCAMSLLSRLFGSGSEPKEPQSEMYNDFKIFPEPVKEGGSYRIAARIEKEIGGEVKSHYLIRADTYESASAATEASILKAKAMIDQQGDRIF